MSAKVQMNGLDELRAELRRLPEELATEAGDIVLAHAEAAKRDVQSDYPTGKTGNLKRRVSVLRNRSKVTTQAIVKGTAPHAFIFEKGTVNRQTDKGWNRGRMPEAPESQRAIPKFIRARAKMIEALKQLVRSKGAQVD
jgi:hypothetical protein